MLSFRTFSKAFHRVWDAGLLAKLNSISVTGDLNKLFSNYLAGRKQRIVLDKINSHFLSIKDGVPQGSLLGPTFLIDVNDLGDKMQCGISLLADDNIIFNSAVTNLSNTDLIE